MNSKELAKKIRIHCLNMTNRGNSSHIGSALSIADILGVLYSKILRFDPQNPGHSERDRFILSKGHAGAALYATLAEVGFFPVSKLESHYQDGSDLSGHVSHKGNPGVEFSTGSLGHGLPVGTGMAYAGKIDAKSFRVVVLLSDGECDEGSNWEAVLFAAHHQLNNLMVVIDYNKIQSLASVKETLELEPFAEKWRSFGWHVEEIDGHCHEQLYETVRKAPELMSESERAKPRCVIANTIKGKGVSFMENQVLWHYKPPKGQDFLDALKELENGGT